MSVVECSTNNELDSSPRAYSQLQTFTAIDVSVHRPCGCLSVSALSCASRVQVAGAVLFEEERNDIKRSIVHSTHSG